MCWGAVQLHFHLREREREKEQKCQEEKIVSLNKSVLWNIKANCRVIYDSNY